MISKVSDQTSIALIQQSQIEQGKKIDKIDINVQKIMEARYVTQVEAQMMISAGTKEIADKVNGLIRIMSVIGATILLAFLGAIIKLVLIP